jgi:collagen type III alpha
MDFRHILDTAGLDVQFFASSDNLATEAISLQWQTWHKPEGAKFVYMMSAGAGGGGSSPVIAAPNTSCFGGGGGGAGGLGVFNMPALLLPNELFVLTGAGGAGGSGGIGGGGGASFVAVEPFSAPNSNANEWALMWSIGGAGAQSNGQFGTGGTFAQQQITRKGHITGIITNPGAQSGANGGGCGGTGNNTSGLNPVWNPVSLLNGGGGGGGQGGGGNSTFANTGNGGTLTLPYTNDYWPAPPAIGLAGNSTVNATAGAAGWMTDYFMLNFGGAGGGGSFGNTFGSSGNGGAGALGCGGGGAGGAGLASARGVGGKGGDGFVLIISW